LTAGTSVEEEKTLRRHSLIAAAALLVATAAPAAGRQDLVEPAAAIKIGRDQFERTCRFCHSLDRSLATTRDAPAWELIVKRMVAYGAPLNAVQRSLVVRYLAARSAFAGTCGGCHELTRLASDKPGARDGKSLGERMAAHVRELERQGQSPAGATFTREDLADIAALLQVLVLY